MITLVEGMIGAGKTYYVVQNILLKYFVFNETSLLWEPKEDFPLALYSNVDNFIVSGDLLREIEKANGLNPFFTVPFQREYARLKKHVYIIDEAQSPKFFHRKFYDAEVFYFFQYHRHLGVDIYLITQDVGQLAKELQTLNEFHIRAVRRSYTFAKEFRYNFMVGKEIFRRKILKKDLRVFSAYRSSSEIGEQKIKGFAGKYYLYVIVFILFAVTGFLFFIKYRLLNRSSTREGFAQEQQDKQGQRANKDQFHEERFRVIAVSGDTVFLKSNRNNKMLKVNVSDVVGEVKTGSYVLLNHKNI